MFKIEQFNHNDLPWSNGVGELFCSRQVHRELGTAVTTDENHTWFFAMEDSAVVGFAAVEQKKDKAIFRHAYTLPSHRGQGVYGHLLKARERFVMGLRDVVLMETTAAPDSHPKLKSAGWHDYRQRGKYVVMHKEVRHG